MGVKMDLRMEGRKDELMQKYIWMIECMIDG